MLYDKLYELLADNYILFSKTQNYHWNVEGACFKSLHELFEEQYSDLYSAIDTLAEIMRTLDKKVDGTLRGYLQASHITEGNNTSSFDIMLKDLIRDHKIVIHTINESLVEAKKADDEAVASFLTDRLCAHKKHLWMLESTSVV